MAAKSISLHQSISNTRSPGLFRPSCLQSASHSPSSSSSPPRWLAIRNRPQEALAALTKLRALPDDHPYLKQEYSEIMAQITDENMQFGENSFLRVLKETFCVCSNLRRVQLTIIAYILAQFSGANSITNYLPTIFGLIGIQSSGARIYSSGLYSLAKLICCVAASLIFVDVLGRRKSLLSASPSRCVATPTSPATSRPTSPTNPPPPQSPAAPPPLLSPPSTSTPSAEPSASTPSPTSSAPNCGPTGSAPSAALYPKASTGSSTSPSPKRRPASSTACTNGVPSCSSSPGA